MEAREAGCADRRYEHQYLRAGEDLALLLTASANSPNLTQYRNHSILREQVVPELVPSLVQRRGAQT
jgi:hypothetical protein